MRTSRKAKLIWLAECAALLACGLLFTPVTAAAFESRCSARIEIVFAERGGNPRNPHLMALTANPGYTLAWIEGKGSRHVYDLTGPAADTMCRDGVELLQRDPAVMELRVVPTEKL